MKKKTVEKIWFRPAPLIALAAVSLMGGCRERDSNHGVNAAGQPVVFTSVAPLAFLVEKLAGGHVEVRTLVGPGQDPHSFSPQPRELVDLGNAAVFFVVGMPYEATLLSRLSRDLKIVDLTTGMEKLESSHDHHHDHAHGHDEFGPGEAPGEAKHDHHNGSDPHVWLSPKLLAHQADLIARTLEEIDPDHRADYQASLETVRAEIEALDLDLTQQLAPMKEQSFYAYHGAFGYFAETYQLWQESIEIGGRSPTPRRVVELIEQARKDGVRVIFVQPQFDQKSAKTIAEAIGGTVVAIDPLEKDVFANLRHIGDEIEKALGRK